MLIQFTFQQIQQGRAVKSRSDYLVMNWQDSEARFLSMSQRSDPQEEEERLDDFLFSKKTPSFSPFSSSSPYSSSSSIHANHTVLVPDQTFRDFRELQIY